MATLIFLFVFGLVVGSFLNVVICRLETGEDIVKKRSHCPKCGKVLQWYDLIPVLSFFILCGKCRYCGEKISWQYPAVELGTGILFSLVFLNLLAPLSKAGGGLDLFALNIENLSFGIFASVCFWLFIAGCLIVIFVYDWRHYLIPNGIVYAAIIVSAIFRLFEFFNPPAPLLKGGGLPAEALAQAGGGLLLSYAISAFAAGAFFLSIVLLTRGRGMGAGDIKLAFLMGLLLGWPDILIALFIAFLIGSLVGIGLILAGRKTLKSQIPFGPFLILGTLIAFFFGPLIFIYYFDFLF